MPDFRFLLKVSRPRFWLYLFGPYIVGLAAGAASSSDLLAVSILAFGIFFLLPANLLLYGINDIFDFETDKLNPKKQDYEAMVQPEHHRTLLKAILVLNLPFIAAAAFLDLPAIVLMLAFLLFSIFYSAPPLRSKAIPIVDSMFNVLYVFPGIFGYVLISGEFPPVLAVIAAFLWTMAMHAYSAIPDIEADTQAGVETVATLLGENGTILFCAACYLGSAILAFPFLGIFAGILGTIYLMIVAVSLFAKDSAGVFAIYRYFPLVNSVVGFVLFWLVAFSNLG